jgi:type VI secretion system secreted protein VgrG
MMGLLSPHLANLLHDPQHNRLLHLSFPHDDGPAATLLANRLDAVESLSRDFAFTMEVLSDDARISLKDVLGRMATVALVRGDGSVRHFNGYVFDFRLVRTDGGFAFYSMVLRPWLAYLKLRKDNCLYQGKTLREQTEAVFAEYGVHADWDFRVTGDDHPVTMASQFGETDHNYLHRRWEAAGWHYWYEHTATGHKLVLADDSTRAQAIDGPAAEIRFQKHGGAVEEEGIGAWSPVRRIMAGRTVLSSFDFKRRLPTTVEVPTLADQGDVLPVETYEYAGAYGFRDRADGNAKGQLRMEELEARGKHHEAEGNNRYVLPGRAFTLVDHFQFDPFTPGSDPGKAEFLIVDVEHSATNNYLQGKEAAPDYRNTMTCTRKSVPWRPGRGFNSVDTRMPGPQTAIVVGPPGEDIHTDEHGRVRVQFHWDRDGTHDERSSAFVRVASSWASGNYGAIALPRIGDEVIVQWLDGNPDLPIITGRVYNGANMAPWQLPAQSALSGIRSSELKGGLGAGNRNNHLLMDDTNGQIQAVLSSDHQHSQLSLGYLTRVTGTEGRRDFRGEGYELRTDGWGALRAAKGLLVTAWPQAAHDEGATQQDNTEGADTLRAVLDSAANRSKAAEMASDARGDNKLGHRGLDTHAALNEHSWSLAKPVVFITGPEGVATSTPRSIVHAAGEDLGNYAVGHLDLTAGKILSLSAAQGMRQHVERGGHSTVVSHGDYHVHVQDGRTEVVSQKGITIEAKSGDITLKTKGGSIVLTESGDILIKGAKETHEIAGTIELGAAKVVNSGSVPAPESKSFWGQMNVGKFSQQLVLADVLHKVGGKAANYAYKIVTKDGAVLKTGKLDAEGKSERVFTDDMEELHAEIDIHGGKWQVVRDERHAIDRPAADPAADADVPVGVSILAEKLPMPVDMAHGLFRPDGRIDVESAAMSVLETRLRLPAAAIVELVRLRGDLDPVAIAKAGATNVIHGAVNDASARLLAALGGRWKPGAALPQEVHGLFERAQAQRAAAVPDDEWLDTDEVVIAATDAWTALSQSEPFAVDLDALPAELRGETGSAID